MMHCRKLPLGSTRGQSLVEVTIATTALVFGLVAVVSGLILSVRNSSVANNQAIATQQTQEAIEVFRRFKRQLGWESFYSIIRADGTNFTYCLQNLPTDTTNFQSISTGNCSVSASYTGFVRQAAISVVSSTEIQMTVTVTWRDGSTTRSATAKQIFQDI